MTMLSQAPRPASAAPVPGLLGAPRPDLATHHAVHGPLPDLTPAQLLAEVQLSGLTGRGGAGFPATIKLRAVQAVSHGRAIVAGNGAEGEPASSKDRQLLFSSPHLVLDGLQLAAAIVGAAQVIMYVRRDAAGAVRAAVAERGRGDRLPVTVVVSADGFVTGQETAVVSALNGGPARPRYASTRVTERGVAGRPTLVQNVETLAHLALIARRGGAWFASTGASGSTGSFLATVHPATTADPFSGPAVWEVPHGTTLRSLLEVALPATSSPRDHAGSRSANLHDHGPGGIGDLQAVLIGGYHGTWVRLPAALDVPLSRDGLQPYGASVGAGVIIPIGWHTCGLETTAQIVRYLAAESAQQCGPCRFGLPHLAGLLTRLAAGPGATGARSAGSGPTGAGPTGARSARPGSAESGSAADVSAIRAAAGLVAGRGACHHPDGTARLVRSAMEVFAPDITLHGHGRCLARTGNEGGWL